MKFQLIDKAKGEFPVHRLCGVSQSGYFAWKDRPASRCRRDDMVLLAPVRSAFALSNGTYGSPRMTRELQDNGFAVGRRRTARLMRENGLKARQKRRFKRTTDSDHAWPIAPNIIDRDFTATGPNEKWGVDIHLLCLDPRGVAVPCCHHRPILAKDRWLGCRRSSTPRSGSRRPA
jgi:putative transposase